MNLLGKKSAAYACYIFINITWYFSWFVALVMSGGLLYEFFRETNIDTVAGVTVPISDTLVSLNDASAIGYLTIESVQAEINYGYLIRQNPDIFIYHFIFLLLIISLFLYGLYKFRALLKSTVYEGVFTETNIRRLKTIAFLIMAGGPLEWLHQYVILSKMGDFVARDDIPEQLNIFVDYLFAGLFVYALATAFEKGYEIYQELKLTV